MALIWSDIDRALKDRLDGQVKVWANKEKTIEQIVPVVIAPPEREYAVAQWPKISWWLIGTDHDIIRETHQSRTGIVTRPTLGGQTANVKQVPIALDGLYQLDAYSRYAGHDRAIQEQIWKAIPPRTFIDVFDTENLTNGQPTVNRLWLFFQDFRQMDAFDGQQQRIYHKVWTWRVLSALDVDPNGTDKKVPYSGLTIGVNTDLSKDSTGINLLVEE
jgi:hypothetical protein